jgi:hypothetical protein
MSKKLSNLASKGHEMVFAEGKDFNVFDDDQLVVVFVEDGAVDNVAQVLLVTLGEEEHGLGIALGRAQQPFALRVLADALEDGLHGAGQLLQALVILRRRRFQPLAGAQAYRRVIMVLEYYFQPSRFGLWCWGKAGRDEGRKTY